MRTTYWVPGARRRGISLVAGIALLCFAGAMVSSSPARAADHPRADSELLTIGDGYAQPQVSTRVRVLQRRLRTLGLRPGPVDGFFGPETKAAVESLQRAVGLQADGIVGRHTRQALRRASGPMLGRGAGYGRRGALSARPGLAAGWRGMVAYAPRDRDGWACRRCPLRSRRRDNPTPDRR